MIPVSERWMQMVWLIVFSCLLAACQDKETEALFVLHGSDSTGLDFTNELDIAIDLNILNYMYYYNGGGTAVADLNNDGLQDIIFSSNRGKEKVYLNQGQLRFRDISNLCEIDGGEKSWTNGVAVADINSDGLLDVYLAQVGTYRSLDSHNKLFICTGISEDGIPRYAEQSESYGLDFKGFSTQAGFFDYDLDGDLDLFLMNHSLHHNGTFGKRETFLNTYDTLSGDRLYRNDGEQFTDVTESSGINSSVIGYGLGLAFSDVNLDGWPDIYIGNDFHENDYLYINQKDGTFRDMLDEKIMHTSRFSMGVDIADVNGDLYPDILSLDMLPEDPEILKSSEGEDALDIFKFKLGYGYNHQYAKNALQVNNGRGMYQDVAMMAGVHATDWSWTPLIVDMDMDGHNDIFISNGMPKRMNDIDYIDFISNSDIQYKIQFEQLTETDLAAIDKIPEIKLYNKFYLNQTKLSFKDVSNRVANNRVSYSNSAVYADLDNDGDFDIVCNNINDEAFLYENKARANSIRISLKTAPSESNAIGSKLLVFARDSVRMFENFSTRGFQSCAINDFLISRAIRPDSLVLVWPDKQYQTMEYGGEDSISFDYTLARTPFDYQRLAGESSFEFEEISSERKLNYTHQENPFVEFNRESLIPHANSTDGPALTVADLNGDGLEDIFIGSAKRKYNAVFIQMSDGSFMNHGDIGIDSTYEEIASLALDLDGNAWPDLVIATGGNEFAYTNDYTSQLIVFDVLSENPRLEKLPLNMTASCVDAADMDGDGDMDLFFGARARVSSYGAEVISAVLINEGNGQFDLFPDEYIPGLKELGMVKDAKWTDFDADGDPDLLVAEEWGGIHLFTNTNARFTHTRLVDKKGWWNFISVHDLDNDGDPDILAGNIGLNSRLKVSASEPVRMYYNDFDDNGSHEQVLSYYLDGKEIPFSNFKELKTQIPSIKKKFLYAQDFARADISALFGMEKVNTAQVYELNYAENVVFENRGNGRFEAHSLPRELQVSALHTAIIDDFNGDGLPDLFTAGNYYDCNIQMGRYDADFGNIAINLGQCRFKTIPVSGHVIRNQVRNSKYINLADGQKAIVLAKNSDRLELLKINAQ